MKSMTGYGRATTALGRHTLTVQVNGVNRKTFDLTLALPNAWETLESAVGEAVRRHVARGKVHLRVELTSSDGALLVWDDAAVQTTLERLGAFAARQSLPFAPSSELIWQIVNATRQSVAPPLTDDVQTVLLATVEEALTAFSAMRGREGAALLEDFQNRLSTLRTHVAAIAARAPEVAPAYREVLLTRLRQAGLALDVTDERVLKEIALFADRCDIAEELTRLRSHFDQLDAWLRTKGEIGRKAEFILQEIGREVHTIGSKANDLAIARHVIELKNECERIREQIANIE